MLKIGLLDFGELYHRGKNSESKLNELFATLPVVDKLGYSRYWLGEHYQPNLAWGSPEILVPLLAGITEQIKIGTAGVLIYLHSTLRVAQSFKIMESLFPGRIDLGLARGKPGNDYLKALTGSEVVDSSIEEYHKRVSELTFFMKNQPDLNHLPDIIQIPAYSKSSPDVWVLASGNASIPVAVHAGANLCVSLFHSALDQEFHAVVEEKAGMIKSFRETFYGEHNFMPKVNVCVAGVCAETSTRANLIKSSYSNKFIKNIIAGDASIMKEELLQLQYKLDVDEIIFFDICQGFREKIDCYTLISETLGLAESVSL